MILSLNNQAILFFNTIVVGLVLGLIYDAFRIFRDTFKHTFLMIQAEDVLYWIIVIFTMFFFMLHENYGEIRFFSICGAFLGMILYFLTISHIVMGVMINLIKLIKYIILLFLRIVFTPFRLIYILLRKPVEKTGKMFYKKSSKVLHLLRLYVRIKTKKLFHSLNIINTKR